MQRLAVIVALAGAWIWALASFEGRIAALARIGADLNARAAANERAVRERERLHGIKLRLAGALRGTARTRDEARDVAAVITRAAFLCRRDGLELRSFARRPSPPRAGGDGGAASRALVEFGVRGPLAAVVRFIRNLPRTGTLLDVESASLARAPAGPSSAAVIDAHLGASVYRLPVLP